MIHLAPNNDPSPVRLAEPPVIAMADTNLTIWRYEDGGVVLRIGSALELGAETILIEPEHLTAVWTTLKRIDEGRI